MLSTRTMSEVVAIVSGNGEDDFNERQILYRMRPIVKEATEQELKPQRTSEKIMTDYENDHGEIDGMYRDPRSSIRIHIPAMLSRSAPGRWRTPNARSGNSTRFWLSKKKVSQRRCASVAGTSGTIAWCCRRRATRRVLSSDLVDKLADHDEPGDGILPRMTPTPQAR